LPLIALQRGANLLIVNYDATPWDSQADVVIHANAAEVLPLIAELVLTD
jgi:NAD-dependent SIR2 family protein deacetylase